eukprot:768335-Hanusia_phi.AAC.2
MRVEDEGERRGRGGRKERERREEGGEGGRRGRGGRRGSGWGMIGCGSESKSALNLNGSLPFTAEHKWGAALAVCSSLSGASGDMVEQSKIVGCSISQLGSEALQTCSISGGDGSSYFVTNEARRRRGGGEWRREGEEGRGGEREGGEGNGGSDRSL